MRSEPWVLLGERKGYDLGEICRSTWDARSILFFELRGHLRLTLQFIKLYTYIFITFTYIFMIHNVSKLTRWYFVK